MASHAALDAVLQSLRRRLDGLSGERRGLHTTYGIDDIGMAAFSVFAMLDYLAHNKD
jgi:hypothetical protein